MELWYDRSLRPLQFWAAILSATRRTEAFAEYDLEAILTKAIECLDESATPVAKSLCLYVLGKVILLTREYYPDWSQWVACAAILSGEWAHDAGDALLIQRSESLFAEYARLLRH